VVKGLDKFSAGGLFWVLGSYDHTDRACPKRDGTLSVKEPGNRHSDGKVLVCAILSECND
jgi:hypothetical protein